MKEVRYASSVVDVICSEGRRRARTKLGGMCFRSSCIAKTHVFVYASSSRAHRPHAQKAFDQHKRLAREERIFDEKEGEWLRHAPMSPEANSIRGTFLKYF